MINTLIYFQESYNDILLEYPYYHKNDYTIVYYIISSNIIDKLNSFTNKDIEDTISKNDISWHYNSIFDKIMNLLIYTDNIYYIDYLMNRNINLNINETEDKYLKYSFRNAFELLILVSEYQKTDKFHYIKKFVEYGINYSTTDILLIYLIILHNKIFEKTFKIKKLSFDRSIYVNNIIYLIDNGANYDDHKIKSILKHIGFYKDIKLYIRHRLLKLIDGCKIQDENKYISNDFIMREICTFI